MKEIEDIVKNNIDNNPLPEPIPLANPAPSVPMPGSNYSATVVNSNSGPNNLGNNIENQANNIPIPKTPFFISAKHEAEEKFSEYRRKLAIRVEIQDFQQVTNENLEHVDPSVVFRDPKYLELRMH